MTPAARHGAAAETLDRILAGAAAEKVLTGWARSARYAGSGDRAAVRDLVYDCLRRRGRYALRAGLAGAEDPALTGRRLILGLLAFSGADPAAVFTGEGHAPASVTPEEAAGLATGCEGTALDDLPLWLHPPLKNSLDDIEAYAEAVTQRAPVWLRVNGLSATRDKAISSLAADGITARLHPDCATALEIVENPRRLRGSKAYNSGQVELQDLSPQRAILALGDPKGLSVLDYCAGGGGKALALAGLGAGAITAHDANPGRMRDLPARARRAGARITLAKGQPEGRFDLVIADVPCSGSGTWARDPDGKWRLDAERLKHLNGLQDSILQSAARHVGPAGRLVYMTCSVFRSENEDRITAFSAAGGFKVTEMRRFGPPEAGDGFFLAILARKNGVA